MTIKKYYSYLLVAIQFTCIGILFATTPFLKIELLSGTTIILGILLGLWAIMSMKESKLHITPEVDKQATLISSGPYKYIRHPMYSAVLLFSFGLLFIHVTFLRLFVLLMLFCDLWIKLHYEETLLAKQFRDYKNYAEKTRRLIPYIL